MKLRPYQGVAPDLFGANDSIPQEFWVGYYSGIECPQGHIAPSYTTGNKCVSCAHQTAKDKRVAGGALSGKGGAARAHIARAIALMDGQKTYTPSRPCKHGHWLRWVGTNNCIECDEMKKGRYAEARRLARLLKIYGLTAEAYAEMLEGQSGRCKICEATVGDRSAFHVDHCHSSGKVRGLLCSRCNQAIGLLRENSAIIRRAAEYIDAAA